MATKYLSKLQGKRVLLIGGTAGIGYAIAEACVEYGADVTVASSKQANVDKAVETLKASYPNATERVRGHICDVTTDDLEPHIKALLDFATNNNTTKLDHIVDTAGGNVVATKYDAAEPSQLSAVFKSRLIPKVVLAKLARVYLNNSYTSSLTWTGGSNTYKPLAGYAILALYGGAGDSLGRGLAKDMAPIRVNIVAPGAIRTRLLERLGTRQGGDVEEAMQRFAKMSLLDRVGQPEEVAESYLAIMKNHFQTGTVVHCDGGYPLL